MKRLTLIVAMALATGCSDNDQSNSRLTKGSTAILVGSEDIALWLPGKEKAMISEQMTFVPPGSKVLIESDEEVSENGRLHDTRMVSVTVMEGPKSGRMGTVWRKDLRPAK